MKRIVYNTVRSNLPTKLSINRLTQYNCKSSNQSKVIISNFIKNEIKIRLAHRVVELENLPYGLNNIQSVKNVTSLYVNSFSRLHEFKHINNIDDSNIFAKLMEDIKNSHNYVEYDISIAIRELITKNNKSIYDYNLDGFLDKFYKSRTGLRILISHYLSMYNLETSIIDTYSNPVNIINHAIEEAFFICSLNNIQAPDIFVFGDTHFSFSYIPCHIYYITLELLKNSIKSTTDKYQSDNLKPINIYLSKGKEELIIKISDKGGGFSRDNMDKIFSYGYTTNNLNNSIHDRYAISGYGHGLPLARLYSRYFGGDLLIIPFECIGTDALIYINRLGDMDETPL